MKRTIWKLALWQAESSLIQFISVFFFLLFILQYYRISESCQRSTGKSLEPITLLSPTVASSVRPGNWLAWCNELDYRSYSGFTGFCMNPFWGMFLYTVLCYFIMYVDSPNLQDSQEQNLVRHLQAAPLGCSSKSPSPALLRFPETLATMCLYSSSLILSFQHPIYFCICFDSKEWKNNLNHTDMWLPVLRDFEQLPSDLRVKLEQEGLCPRFCRKWDNVAPWETREAWGLLVFYNLAHDSVFCLLSWFD